jgi:hypothetical protein
VKEMEIVYKNWESGQGLEEIQAKIYTELSGLPARADEIGPRNDGRGSDMTRYVLTESGEPLAYITSSKSGSTDGRYYIGYPWAMPECPKESQLKIFKEQLEVLKGKEDMESISTTVVLAAKNAEEQVQFFEENGFTETSRVVRVTNDYNVEEIAELEVTGRAAKLTSRVATADDADILIQVIREDPRTSGIFPTDEAARAYIENRVLKDGHALIVFDGDEPVASSALLKYEPDGFFVTADSTRIVPRYVATRPKYAYAWEHLFIALAKESVSAGWNDIPLRTAFGTEVEDPTVITMARMDSSIDAFEILLTYEQ